MNPIKPTLTAIPAAILAVCAAFGQTPGSISGMVLENGLVPLAGATVYYREVTHMERDPHGGSRPVPLRSFGTVRTAADGTFAISGLPPDWYVVCADGPSPVHIGSCGWNASDHRVLLAAGQVKTGLRLSVTRGAIIDIAITDQQGCIARNSKASVYVFQDTMLQPAHLTSSAGGVFHYQVLVPQQAPLRVSPVHRFRRWLGWFRFAL